MNNQSQLDDLLDLREEIAKTLKKIDAILQIYFPDQYPDAYQHWMPQILTALYNDVKWLPRGQVSLQDTIDRIKDDCENSAGVSKYIK
jgi:hypothetical protein